MQPHVMTIVTYAQQFYDDRFAALTIYGINLSFACIAKWRFSARHKITASIPPLNMRPGIRK